MICYKDTTFCVFDCCGKFASCGRALTREVKENAVKWWGSDDAPIMIFADKPQCYREAMKNE